MDRGSSGTVASQKNASSLKPYLSPLSVWALAFGCSVGWGAFVMPGNTFLPIAGPWGTVIGILIGAFLMFIIGASYRYLAGKYPSEGGAYTYASKVIGHDHGFLCAWFLILTYLSIIWANATALSLIARFLFGDLFQFGFHYTIAGFTVYFGELLLSVGVLLLALLVCLAGGRITAWTQTLFACLLFFGVIAVFAVILVRQGGFQNVTPAFAPDGSKTGQVLTIIALAPWAYIGFESVSHSAAEFKFSPKKLGWILGGALFTGALTYSLLALTAVFRQPVGNDGWTAYLSKLGDYSGVEGLPTFFNARDAFGNAGLWILVLAAFGGIATGLIANMIAISRLAVPLSRDGILPESLGRIDRRGVPKNALIAIAVLSALIPLLGRAAISWIVDVTTIGAAVVYLYTALAALIQGRRDRKTSTVVFGLLGVLIAAAFLLYYLFPNFWTAGKLANESYLIFVIWSILGFLVFLRTIRKDDKRSFGHSGVVWVFLLMLLMIISMVWIRQAMQAETDATADEIVLYHDSMEHNAAGVVKMDSFATKEIREFSDRVFKMVLLLVSLIAVAVLVDFGIFSIIKRRERLVELEKKRVEEVSRAKSVFLSNMSHDIRTPMNAIIGYTHLALAEEDITEKNREYLNKIDYSGKYLLSLINDVLDMNRIESGKMEMEPVPADLNRLMTEAEEIFAVQMREKRLIYTVKTDHLSHPFVVCDVNRLERILMNLISNAMKYTPEGAVTVILRELGDRDGVATFELVVRDTGIGMSREFADHVFEAFERERSKTVESIQGTGLGMAITKSFVEMMGGTIRVDTEQGKGTAFSVFLPFRIATEEEISALRAEEETSADQYRFDGLNVLLVEDNPINAEIATMLLTKAGFTLEHAENGRAAVEAVSGAQPGHFDLVMMDIQMPVMNGYDATRAIRVLPDGRGDVPIIAMSANAFAEDVAEAKKAGMNDHVSKPIDVPVMMATIQRVLQKKN